MYDFSVHSLPSHVAHPPDECLPFLIHLCPCDTIYSCLDVWWLPVFRACLLVGRKEGAFRLIFQTVLIVFIRSEHESSRCHEVDPGKRGQFR